MRSAVGFPLLGLATLVRASVHHLIVGTFGTDYLYTVAFDDEALTLDLVHTTNTTGGSSWIALSHDKKNLYGTIDAAFASYSIANATDLTFDTTLSIGGNCSSSKAIFVVAASEPPYAVYGTPFGGTAGCGTVMSVASNGTLSEVIQNYTYLSTSGVHGLALDKSNSYLYSADDSANSLWTHKVDNSTGKLTYVDSISGPVSGSDPRHVTVHPKGKYLYTVLEGANELAVYTINQTTHEPTFTNTTYALIPSDVDSSEYWSDEVALSYNSTTLWATSRSRETNSTGYISAFSLSTDGQITKQLFLTPTTGSGGTANSVAPSDFSDKWVALTDSAGEFVEIWTLSTNGSAEVVAHLDIEDGGCCANAVWYD